MTDVGALAGLRILEIADQQGEYCGRLLAGMGADVVKIEPPVGSPTRRFPPFHHDVADPDRSLHFWHYNVGKRSVVVDLETAEGRQRLQRLAAALQNFTAQLDALSPPVDYQVAVTTTTVSERLGACGPAGDPYAAATINRPPPSCGTSAAVARRASA